MPRDMGLHRSFVSLPLEGTRSMPELKVKVEDMSCGHCVAAIKGKVERVPGVTGMEASLETKVVTVEFEGDVDQGAVITAVQDAGYTPELVD